MCFFLDFIKLADGYKIELSSIIAISSVPDLDFIKTMYRLTSFEITVQSISTATLYTSTEPVSSIPERSVVKLNE